MGASKQRKVIIITGTPGTGKTYLAKKLSLLLQYKHIDVNKLVKTHHLYDSYDRKKDTFVVDLKLLNPFLIRLIKSTTKGLIIDSHMSHFLPCKYVDICIVCKCDLKTLTKRLEKRPYSKAKIRENLDSEIFDICLHEAEEQNHSPIVVDCSKKADLNFILLRLKKQI